jgi:hypothetical protein
MRIIERSIIARITPGIFVLYDHVGLSECTSTHTLFLSKPVICDGHNTTSIIIINKYNR